VVTQSPMEEEPGGDWTRWHAPAEGGSGSCLWRHEGDEGVWAWAAVGLKWTMRDGLVSGDGFRGLRFHYR
jgi:hypothetical protein